MRKVLAIVSVILLFATEWAGILNWFKMSIFFGICWVLITLVYVITGAYD